MIGCFLLQCTLGAVVAFSSLLFWTFYQRTRYFLTQWLMFCTDDSTERVFMSSRALEVLPLPPSANRAEYDFYFKEPRMPEIIPPTLQLYSCAALYKVRLAEVSAWTLWALLFTSSSTPSPTSPSKHHFCRGWSVSLLQSRQSPPLNTPHCQWKATLSHCSATWPPPTASTRRATGWRTGRRSRKHAPQTGTLSTGRSHGNLCVCVCVWVLNAVFSSLMWLHARCVSTLQAEQTKRRRRRSVHVRLHLRGGSSSQRHHRS